MIATHQSDTELIARYRELRGIHPDDVRHLPLAAVEARLSKRRPSGVTAAFAKVAYLLGVRLAHEVSETEFVEALNTGELPPLKLSAGDMAVLRGARAGEVLADLTSVLSGILSTDLEG